MPDEFGRYRLIELLGRGGMGEVYRAHDTVRDRVVALKVLPDYLAGDESFETRFRRESRMAAKLNEPHIIPIHDFGEIDGRLFLDMRLVEGHDLGSILASRGVLPVGVAVELVAQIASALDAAHLSGLVHRDVKPSNILLTGLTDALDDVPFAYLVDFGIARSAAQEGTALTATTATVGTVAYMSPERISGLPSDLRTDVYALACVLYETLTGRKPYDGEMFAQMYAHLHTAPPAASARRSEVPPQLDAVIAKGMAKDPDQRYLSAGALATAARAAVRDAVRTDTVRDRPAAFGAVGAPVAPPRGDTGSGVWTPPPPPRTPNTPPLGSAPPFPPAGPGRVPDAGRSRRTAAIAAAIVVVLAIGAAIAFVASRGSNDSAANGSSSAAVSSSGSSSPPTTSGGTAAAPVLATGSAATPTVSWAHFAAFSKLLGTRDGDTDAAFNHGSCTLSGPGTDSALGVDDEVTCTYSGSAQNSAQKMTVARFDSPSVLQAYLGKRIGLGFGEQVWTVSGQPRGVTVVSPHGGTGPSSLASTICGLPGYLVQVSAPDRTQVDTDALHEQTWDKATFPDAVPPECDSTFRTAQPSAVASASVGPAKGVLSMASEIIEPLTQQGDSSRTGFQVITSAGVEAISVGQQGSVTFWSEAGNTLQQVGTSTYPYSSSLGPPDAGATGAVLTGMTHATFVVSGTFSGDGSGNAVAYTDGSKGWGAIKAQSNGDLTPSGKGVGIGGVGLSNNLALTGGRLATYDCSSQVPIADCSENNRIIKYWTWKKDHFNQTGSAGRTK
ncbi:serine/threonine-protein kinase [uncultured Jatrophihabitans sp.]|uniref:serine/threonine-protein kinase n=1 Tax=uncultured Jatrophihabitans sp. TaxID=1610747 RepID=UPI0035C990DC